MLTSADVVIVAGLGFEPRYNCLLDNLLTCEVTLYLATVSRENDQRLFSIFAYPAMCLY